MRATYLLLIVVCLAAVAVRSADLNSAADNSKSSSKSLLRNSSTALRTGRTAPRPYKTGIIAEAAATVATLPTVQYQEKIISHCLMITDVSVVNDPRAAQGGKWSFGYLMRAMANADSSGIRPEQLVRRWLAHWEQDQTVNGFTVEKRDGIQQFIDDWPKNADGSLDLDKAPFRLLAIVNRLDLRNNLVLGVPRIGGGGAGEGRFVFCAVDPSDEPLPFTVIFEYGIKLRTFEEVQGWARRWYDLKDITIGSPAYLHRLESITEQFAGPAMDPEQPPNGSALSQLRTNEIALGNVWELREFRLDFKNTGYLRQVTVKQNPDLTLQGTAVLGEYIKVTQGDIIDKRHAVPVEYPAGTPFLAGSALAQRFFAWRLPDDAPPELENARQLFAFHTCNGCHLAETQTQFTHVGPRTDTEPASLSSFLTAVDLAEREKDLRGLVEKGRDYESQRLPLQFVH